MGLKINIKWEKKELTLEEKYKKQQKKIGILILLILLMILGFFVYEFKFAEKSIFDKGDKYEEYNPNYEEESNVSHAEAKETSNVSVDVTSEVTSNILSTDTSNTSNTSNTDNTDNTKVSSIKINDTNMTMVVGSTKKLDYTIYPDTAQDKNVSYKINDTSIATIDNNGIITAKKIGKTTINVTTSDGNKTVTANLTVLNSAIKVTGIKASSSSITISIGDTTKFNYSITPNDATNKDVTYSSSNTGVAKVDSNGKITGIKEGSAKISATTKDGNYSTEMTVTVKQSTVAVTKVNLSYTSTIQTVGKASSIQANVLPTNATSRNVTWSSSNTSVATVSGSASENIVGRIVCLKAGTTKITALAGGVSKSLDITCKNSILVNPEYVTLYKYMHPQSDNSFESVTLYVTSSDTASNIKYTVTPTASSRNVSSGISNNQYHLNINSMYLNQGKYTIKFNTSDNVTTTSILTVHEYKITDSISCRCTSSSSGATCSPVSGSITVTLDGNNVSNYTSTSFVWINGGTSITYSRKTYNYGENAYDLPATMYLASVKINGTEYPATYERTGGNDENKTGTCVSTQY